MRLIWILVIVLTTGAAGWSQAVMEHSPKINRTASKSKSPTSLRIAEGKVWVNDRQVPSAELPASLKLIDPYITYEARVAGVAGFSFNLGEHYYQLENGQITELGVVPDDQSAGMSDKAATEAYYSQLKREAPSLFYGLSREGILLEQVRSLLIEYSRAKGTQRDKIKEELRQVLGQLYDLNERNKELEIEELEQMIQAAKEEVQYRKAHKPEIIQHSLDQLLKE